MNTCSASLWTVMCLLLCAGATTDITILPRNLTIRDGEYATFTCEVPCSHAVYWYVGDFYNSFPLPEEDTVPGLTYTRTLDPEGGCAFSDPGTYTDSITLLATPDLDHVVVQCSASMISCAAGDTSCGSPVYSRFRTLRVESPVVSPSPSYPSSPSSPSSSSSSSSSSSHTETTSSSSVEQSSACPAPTRVLVPTTETSVSTTTKTETVTETVHVLKTTELPAACSGSGSGSLLKGVGSTSVVAATILHVVLSLLSLLIQL